MQYTQNKSNGRAERNSGIELLKIIAMVLITISHVVQTLSSKNIFISYSDYVVDVSTTTTDIITFIVALFRHFGSLGNTIFFICSAWFLLNSTKYNKQKWFFILFEIWIISISILLAAHFIMNDSVPVKILILSVLPTTFASNWYMTCYLLFYPIHPLLNSIIHKMDKRHLFRISAALFVLYCGFNFLYYGLFFPSDIILWISIYFVMAYLQLYMDDFVNNVKKNIMLLLFGFLGYIGLSFVINILGLNISFFSDKLLYWSTNCNPFFIMISIALFNLMRKQTYKNKVINYISSLSLLFYIIHENCILRTFLRPAMWDYIYQNFGYDNILLWVFAMVAVIFLSGMIVSFIYDQTLRPLTRMISNKLYSIFCKIYLKIEAKILKER